MWRSKFLPITTFAFFSWDDLFTHKWTFSSPKNLFKCTESPPMLSTTTSLDWGLYLSWNNHLLTSFRLEMDVAGFYKRQSKTSDTDRYKRYFSTARVSQVKLNNLERIFEQRSELQVAKCLIVHVLCCSYNVYSVEFRNKSKVMQQWSLHVANDIVLN